MYTPQKFNEDNRQTLIQVMKEFPFCTVISNLGSQLQVSHLPVIAEDTGGSLVLRSHMARGNPQWKQFTQSPQVTLLFHGPHTYIHPGWYTENDVPTWNYVAVHATGTATLVEDYARLLAILKSTNDRMSEIYPEKWSFVLPEDLSSEKAVTGGIIGFEIREPSLQGKFKLNQNRSEADRVGVVKGLSQRKDENSQKISRLMKSALQSEIKKQ